MKILANVKATLKKNKIFSTANAKWKAARHKRLWRRVESRYSRGTAKDSIYNEKNALNQYRDRLNVEEMVPLKKPVGALNIFWVGASRDQDESGFLQALRKIGTVTVFFNWTGDYGLWLKDEQGELTQASDSAAAKNDASLLEQIERAHESCPIDLLIGQMWANYLNPSSLTKIRSKGIPVINISMDDRLPDNWLPNRGKMMGALGLGSSVDIFLTTSAETCEWYWKDGFPAIFWPLASSPEVFMTTEKIVRDIDVLFIGNKYGYRETLISGLRERGIYVECRGAGWESGPASAAVSASLFKRARIILGIGTVGHCTDVYTLKLRDFDAPMAGGLYITHRNPDLIELYKEGREIECYDSIDECATKIRYYLSNPEKLSQIAAAGQNIAIGRDTWDSRLTDTFIKLGFLEVSVDDKSKST